jgi:hypothetical protein
VAERLLGEPSDAQIRQHPAPAVEAMATRSLLGMPGRRVAPACSRQEPAAAEAGTARAGQSRRPTHAPDARIAFRDDVLFPRGHARDRPHPGGNAFPAGPDAVKRFC